MRRNIRINRKRSKNLLIFDVVKRIASILSGDRYRRIENKVKVKNVSLHLGKTL